MSLEAEAPLAVPAGADEARETLTGGDAALTPRQTQILALIQSGKSNKEIAADLGIGLGTVKQHINVLFRKLDVSNRTMAVQRAATLPTGTGPRAEPAHDGAIDIPMETRPAVVLAVAVAAEDLAGLSIPDGTSEAFDTDDDADADPAAAVHAALSGVASYFAATFLPRRNGGDLLFGLHRCREQDVTRAIRAAFAIAHDPVLRSATAALRMGLDTGLVASGITADGHWDGHIAAGSLLADVRALALDAPGGRLVLGPWARERLTGFCGLSDPPPESFDLGAHVSLPYGIAAPVGGLFGRGHEIGILEADIAAAARGRGRAILIEGEAGLGKSALLAALPDLCADAGASCEVWRCLPADGQPLTPARGFLMNVATHRTLDAETLISCLAGRTATGPDHPDTPPAATTAVVVVDDVHSLPRPQAAALFKAASTAARRGTLVVVAARPLVSASVGPIPDGRQLRLGRLDRLAMEALVDSVAGVPLRPDACAAICDRAAGVPMFGAELARAVDAAGTPPTQPPLALLSLLVARLDGFQLDHRLLRLLADRPGQRRIAALREAWPGPPDAFDAAIDLAVSVGLVTRQDRPTPVVAIPHPMIFAVLNFVMTHWKPAGGTS